MIASYSQRLPLDTDARMKRRIARKTQRSVAFYAQNPDDIPARLRELDEEWDVERVLALKASVLVLIGLLFGAVRGRWFVLSVAGGTFLLQHALEGWSPPLPVLRRMGYRTAREVDIERNALLILQGKLGGFAASDRNAAAMAFVGN